MVTNSFNKKNGILTVKYEGETNIKEVLENIENTKVNIQYSKNLKVLLDARKAKFVISIEELEKIKEINFSVLNKYNSIKEAMVISNPKNAALSMLYNEITNTSNYQYEVFSTLKAALTWLNK